MPRDSAGNYNLVSGNPVQSGEVISSSWANNTLDDVAVALSDSLDRNGRGGMLAPFRFADGTNLLPGASWTNETTTGLYRFDGGDLRLGVLTQDVMRWQTTGVQIWDNGESQWNNVLTDNGTDSVPVPSGTNGQTLRWGTSWEATSDLVVSDAGNVGIGATSPANELVVNGTAAFGATNSLPDFAEVQVRAPASTTKAQLYLNGRGISGANWKNGLVLGINNAVYGSISTSDSGAGLQFNTGTSDANITEHMRIDSAGNVGIGTTNPLSRFAVVEDGAYTGIVAGFGNGDAANALQVITNSNTEWGFNALNSRNMVFNTNQTERMRIDSAGNVGIGTDSPAEKLEIADNARLAATPTIRITNTDQFAAATNVVGSLEFFSKDLSQPNIITGYVNNISENAGTNYALTLGTASNANATEHMRITSTGNVGIGTTDPTVKLQVDNAGTTAAAFYNGANPGSATAAPVIRTPVVSGYSSSPVYGFHFQGSTGITNPASNVVGFTNNGGERMRIDTSGSLLVGKTSSSLSAAGHELFADGRAYHTAGATTTLSLNKAGNGNIVGFYIGGADEGSIFVSAGLTPTFAGLSDIQLKENIADMEPQLSAVNALRPVSFDWKSGKGSSTGFIAQEVQTVWPHKVHKEDDSGMLFLAGMSDTDARLVKAIQEQQSMIADLTARVEQLEN